MSHADGFPAGADAEVIELLDDIGLDFALNTHHPLTHLEMEGATDRGQARLNCPDPT